MESDNEEFLGFGARNDRSLSLLRSRIHENENISSYYLEMEQQLSSVDTAVVNERQCSSRSVDEDMWKHELDIYENDVVDVFVESENEVVSSCSRQGIDVNVVGGSQRHCDTSASLKRKLDQEDEDDSADGTTPKNRVSLGKYNSIRLNKILKSKLTVIVIFKNLKSQ